MFQEEAAFSPDTGLDDRPEIALLNSYDVSCCFGVTQKNYFLLL